MATGKPEDKGKPSAYALLQRDKKKHKAKVERERRVPKNRCAANKRTGGTCNKPAGWGTNHVGMGKCRFHGGMQPSHVKAAAKAEYRRLLGSPIEINPLDALLWCIKIRAGEVKWLSDRMMQLDEKHWIEDTMVGKQFHLYARERQHAMNDLARYSQMAISLGIAERAVKLAETYGELLAVYTKGIIDELWPFINEAGREIAPNVVRRHLIALDGGRTAVPEIEAASIDAEVLAETA